MDIYSFGDTVFSSKYYKKKIKDNAHILIGRGSEIPLHRYQHVFKGIWT